MSEASTESITSDVDRIMSSWFRDSVPGEVIRMILNSWGIAIHKVVLTRGLSAYSLDLRSIYLHEDIPSRLDFQTSHLFQLENQLLCKEWIKLRIHKSKGRPANPEDDEFISRWVEEFFLPQKKFEQQTEYRAIQDWSTHGHQVSHRQIWSLIRDLATEYHCTPTFVQRALQDRGFIDNSLKILCSRADNVVSLVSA